MPGRCHCCSYGSVFVVLSEKSVPRCSSSATLAGIDAASTLWQTHQPVGLSLCPLSEFCVLLVLCGLWLMLCFVVVVVVLAVSVVVVLAISIVLCVSVCSSLSFLSVSVSVSVCPSVHLSMSFSFVCLLACLSFFFCLSFFIFVCFGDHVVVSALRFGNPCWFRELSGLGCLVVRSAKTTPPQGPTAD